MILKNKIYRDDAVKCKDQTKCLLDVLCCPNKSEIIFEGAFIDKEGLYTGERC